MIQKRLFIVAAHEPELDPRVHWVAQFAPADFEATVLGIWEPQISEKKIQTRNYKMKRVLREPLSNGEIAGLLPAMAVTAPITTFFSLLALIFFAGVAFIALLIKVTSPFVHHILRRIPIPVKIVDEAKKLRGSFRLACSNFVKGPFHFLASVRYFFETNRALYHELSVAGDIDLIHANDLDVLPACIFFCRNKKTKILYDSHEFWPFSDLNFYWWETWFWSLLEWELVRKVDAAFTVSPDLAEVLTKRYGVKFGSIPNCEPLDENSPSPSRDTGKNGVIRFLYQGNFAIGRGLEELISAWAGLDGEHAHLLVRGPVNASRDILVETARKNGTLDKTVFFLPPVGEQELVSACADADVGIIPYRGESPAYRYCCPNKLSQYMKGGLAILANDLVFVKRVVQNAHCGKFYSVDQPDTIRAAVRAMSGEIKSLQTMQDNSVKNAKENFNWQHQSEALYSRYQALVGGTH